MLASHLAARPAHPAIVTRQPRFPERRESYLLVTARGANTWIDDPERATAFPSMREAARAALRLPSFLRAYGLPLGTQPLQS